MLKTVGFTRLIIGSFLIFLLVVAGVSGLDVVGLVSDTIVRVGMNLVMVLALIPTIRGGLGLNFGLPVGICCGLLGIVIAVEYDLQGWFSLLTAVGLSVPLAVLGGIAYAWLLERVKGQEMMVGTYIGFSVVALMCMVWLLGPFASPEMVWALGGKGLRTTVSLSSSFGQALDKFLAFDVRSLTIPTGLLLTVALFCWLVSFYVNSTGGLRLLAAGQNPMYARSSGVDIQMERRNGVIVSTVLSAIGIVVYAQSFGFLQLYLAPLMMAFPAVASILIGGATVRHATVTHAVVGTVLFQGLLTVALPVSQQVISGNISEIARVLVSNGMILYALTRAFDE